MSTLFFKSMIYVFIAIGILLLGIATIGIFHDNKIHSTGSIDWIYMKQISDVCAFLSVPWNIVGVFLLYLTLNIQQEQFKKTDDYIRQQQFETTFFNMLNVLTDIKRSTHYEFSTENQEHDLIINEKKDQEFFDYALKTLKNKFKAHYDSLEQDDQIKKIILKIKNNKPTTELEKNIIRDDLNLIYLDFYEDYHSNLGHYFRYTYNLIKFAINIRQDYEDEKKYIDLIQAQLTNDELSLIFYNAYSENGLNTAKEYKFHEWLDSYNFFENIDSRSLLMREHHVLYSKTRFKFLNMDELRLKIS